MTSRLAAAEALVKSIRSGEHSAAVALGALLSDDVVLEANGPMPGAPTTTFTGRNDVLERLSGNWAVTWALRHARWTTPAETAGVTKVSASFEYLGGIVPAGLDVSIAFDDADRISRVGLQYTPRQPQPTETIPPGVIPLINNARINETPICVAHTDENGDPVLTFRGSIQVWSDTALCAWIRQASGGLVRSLAKNPKVQMIYRDGPRAMLMMQGQAHIEEDEAVRTRVFDMMPEVEQNHDPARKGAAMIIELDRMMGFSSGGEPVRMARKA